MTDLKDFISDLRKFLLYLDGRKSLHTIRAYKSSLLSFLNFIKNNKVEPYDRKTIEDYLIHLKEEGIGNRSLNRHLFALRSLFRFMDRLDIITPVERYTDDRPDQESISIDKLKTCLPACRTSTEKLLITILISTGARIGEIALLDKTRFTDASDKFLITMMTEKKRKGNITRVVPIKSKWAVDTIRDCLSQIPENKIWGDRSTQSLRNIVASVGKDAGITGLHPHSFRHALITDLYYNKNVKLKVIQRLVGHSSVTITEGYIHERDDDIINATPEI
jgi:integrase/recombinase XerD